MFLHEATNLNDLRTTIEFLYGLVPNKSECVDFLKESEGSLHLTPSWTGTSFPTYWIMALAKSLIRFLNNDSVSRLLTAGFISSAIIYDGVPHLVATRLGYAVFTCDNEQDALE